MQGNIAKWRVKEGDVVAPGLLYADVETDKATIEWESQEDGFVAKLLVGDGAQNLEVRGARGIQAEDHFILRVAVTMRYHSGSGFKPHHCHIRSVGKEIAYTLHRLHVP